MMSVGTVMSIGSPMPLGPVMPPIGWRSVRWAISWRMRPAGGTTVLQCVGFGIDRNGFVLLAGAVQEIRILSVHIGQRLAHMRARGRFLQFRYRGFQKAPGL